MGSGGLLVLGYVFHAIFAKSWMLSAFPDLDMTKKKKNIAVRQGRKTVHA
jgi:hypothetical protein